MTARAPTQPTTAERRIAILRLVILIVVLSLMWWDLIPPENQIRLTGLSVLIVAYSLGIVAVMPRLAPALRNDLSLTLDILAVLALVVVTGGIRSSLLLLFYLPVLAAATRSDLRNTILAAVAVSAIVVWLWISAEGGLLALGQSALRASLFTVGSFGMALIFGMLAQESRLSRERAAMNRLLDERLAAATAQLRQRLADLESSHLLARRLSASTKLSEVFTIVADAVRDQLEAPYGAVFLFDRPGGGLAVAHVSGTSVQESSPMMYACADRLADDAAEPMAVDASEGVLWTHGICVPLRGTAGALGAVCAGGSDEWRSPDITGRLRNIADQGGMALERALLLADLQRLALTDAEGQLHTADQLDQILREEVQRSSQLGGRFALLKLQVVDASDVSAADPTVALLARRITAVILEAARRVDVVARSSGGDLFILLPMSDLQGARAFALDLQDRLRRDPLASRLAPEPGVQIAIGIATFPDDGTAMAELYRRAQHAVQASEAAGRIVWAGEIGP